MWQVLENLLSLFFALQKFVKQGYTSGGAGYVISRAALKLIAEGMQSDRGECRKRGGAEDVNLGKFVFLSFDWHWNISFICVEVLFQGSCIA